LVWQISAFSEWSGNLSKTITESFPIWIGVGGTPESFVRAGLLGLPLMVAIIGGKTHRFRPLVDLYRQAGREAGYSAERLKVGGTLARLYCREYAKGCRCCKLESVLKYIYCRSRI
jgi:hypothetical protein